MKDACYLIGKFMENWFIQQLRLTVFVANSASSLDEVWGLITTEEPEVDEARPRDGYRKLACAVDDYLLELQALPGRLDISESPHMGMGISPVFHLGTARPRVEKFSAMINTILPKFSFEIHRMALGLVLLQKTDGRVASYQKLQEYLPVTLDIENAREFMYQINYPKVVDVDHEQFELNRISRWSAAIVQHFAIRAGEGGAVPSGVVPEVVSENFVRLEVDNSTPADRTLAIQREKLCPLFNHLVSLAEVSVQGDRK